MEEICQAGSRCKFGGKWKVPCENGAIHFVSTGDGEEPIKLCNPHFAEVYAAGLIEEPNIGKEEFDRREKG